MVEYLLAHFVVPMGNIIKGLSVGDVIDNDDAIGVSIVAIGDGPESLLSSSIPLTKIQITSTSLALSPLTLTILVFLIVYKIQNRLR